MPGQAAGGGRRTSPSAPHPLFFRGDVEACSGQFGQQIAALAGPEVIRGAAVHPNLNARLTELMSREGDYTWTGFNGEIRDAEHQPDNRWTHSQGKNLLADLSYRQEYADLHVPHRPGHARRTSPPAT